MTEADVILYIVVGTALAFDFTNGFHDTANVVATSISTRAMSPRIAVSYAAILNFAGAFISLEVAATVASDVVVGDVITPDDRLRRAGRRDRLEPHHLVLRLTVQLIPRAYRRRRRLRVRGGRQRGDPLRRGDRQGPGAGDHRPDRRLHRRRTGDRRLLPRRRTAAAGARDPRASSSGRSSRAACSRSPMARTTLRRRWASSRSR